MSAIPTILSYYFTAGIIFALLFVTIGIGAVDNGARSAKLSVRFVLFPGAVALWPFLILIWLQRAFEKEVKS